jgi:hypothetical protein
MLTSRRDVMDGHVSNRLTTITALNVLLLGQQFLAR